MMNLISLLVSFLTIKNLDKKGGFSAKKIIVIGCIVLAIYLLVSLGGFFLLKGIMSHKASQKRDALFNQEFLLEPEDDFHSKFDEFEESIDSNKYLSKKDMKNDILEEENILSSLDDDAKSKITNAGFKYVFRCDGNNYLCSDGDFMYVVVVSEENVETSKYERNFKHVTLERYIEYYMH